MSYSMDLVFRVYDARIAALEAENERLRDDLEETTAQRYVKMRQRAERAEAALARLKSGLLRNRHPSGRPEMGTK